MKAISTKGLILRMLAAFVAVVVIMNAKSAHAGEVFYPGNLSRIEMQGDNLAQMYKSQMPQAPTHQQYLNAQSRLSGMKAAGTQLSTGPVDGVSNMRQTPQAFKY